MKRAERQGRSAKFRRSNGSQLNIVNLKIDEVPVVSTSLPKKLELLIKQHEYEYRMHGRADDPLTANPANDVHPLFGTVASDQMLTNASRSAPNVRPRPYQPISSHQYLTLTELKDTAVQDGDKHLGRPTRTTLLRDRQRCRSVSTGCEASQKNGQKQAVHVPTRYEAVTNILYSMIPPGQSLHSFISGARYNKAHWIESLGILGLDSDLPSLSSLNAPKCRPVSVPHDVSYVQKAPSDSPVNGEDSVFKDEDSATVFPLLSNEQTVLKPATEHRSLKVAWEEVKLTAATVSDKTAADNVRFDREQTLCEGGSVPGIHRHDKGQSIARPSSVRLFALPLAKPGADMESVMIHGTSITGGLLETTSRDFSNCHPSQAEWSKEMPRSWSARSCPDPLDPEALSRLTPLKVTGVRVSGESGKAGGSGGKVSTFRLNRIKNGFASSETADCSGGRQENCGFQLKADPDNGSVHLEAVEQQTPGRSTDLENLVHRSEEEAKISVSSVLLSSSGAAEEPFDGGDKESEELFASGEDGQLPEGSLFDEETADIDSFEMNCKAKGHSEDTRIETEGGATEEPRGAEDDVLFFITEEDSGDVRKDSGGYRGNGREAEQQNSDSDDLDSMKFSAM